MYSVCILSQNVLVFATMTHTVILTIYKGSHMSTYDYTNTNEYPRIETVESVTTTAVQITLPRDCTSVSFGSVAALHWANTGSAGQTIGSSSSGADITSYAFVPANNMFNLPMESGKQSNRNLLVVTQSGTADLHLCIIKSK
jgi:hypothetical protein